MEWITPIFDRTVDDVANVKAIIQEFLRNPDEQTRQQLLGELRGTISTTTMNRIINNTQFIEEKLLKYGYNPKITHQKLNWSFSEIPELPVFVEMVRNLKALLKCFYEVSASSADLSEEMLNLIDFNEVNAMEKILYDITVHLDLISQRRLWCGTTWSGATVVGGFGWKIE